MEISKFIKTKNNKYKVVFTDNKEYIFYDDIIVNHNLLINRVFEQAFLDKLLKENEYLAAYYRSIKYLNTRLRTKKELVKLLKKDYEQTIIDQTIKRLQNEGYLDENKYLKAYLNDQINLTLNGPYKIKRNLEELGLKSEAIENELAKIDNSLWQERINKIITKRVKLNHKLTANMIKQKLSNELFNLGYDNTASAEQLTLIKIKNDEKLVYQAGDKIWLKYQKKYDPQQLINVTAQKLQQKGFAYEEIEKYLDNKKRNL